MIQPNTQGIKLSFIALGFLIVAGCARTTQPDQPEIAAVAEANARSAQVPAESVENAAATEDNAVPVPEVVAIDPVIQQWSDSLKKYFDESQVALLNRAVLEYRGVNTASDVAHLYQVVLRDSIQPLVEQQFRSGCKHADYSGFADDDWDWLGEVIPFIGTKVSCHHLPDGTVKCSHIAPISLLPLRDMASNTPESEDDLYFDALIAIHTGTEAGQPVGFEVFDGQDNYHTRQTVGCDPCEVGMLGDGHRSEIVSKMAQAARARKLFNKAFTNDLTFLLGSLQQDRYHFSKAAVVHELDEIINIGSTTRLLSKREISALQETRLWVQAKEGGFECPTGDCDTATASFE